MYDAHAWIFLIVFLQKCDIYINISSVCLTIFEAIDVSEIGLCFENNWNDAMMVKVKTTMWKPNKHCLGFVQKKYAYYVNV